MQEVVGKILVKMTKHDEGGNDVIKFEMSDGSTYQMYHRQDCCEFVQLIDGPDDLFGKELNQEIKSFTEKSNESENLYGHETWTFYDIQLENTFFTFRWHGESNGYYSEGVSFEQVE